MPEQEEPLEEGQIEEEVEGEEQEAQEDRTGCYVTLAMVLGVIILIVWGGWSLRPYIANWLEDVRTPDFDPDEFECKQPEVGEFCEVYAEDLVALALETACQPVEIPACPPSADLNWWPAETADIPGYLDQADHLIERMNEAAGMHDSLKQLMYAQGGSKAELRRAFTDKPWIALRDEFDRRVSEIGGEFDRFWPPPPSNSTSSLLDAHARLMMAWRHLDATRDLMWTGVRLNEPMYVYRYGNTRMEQMAEQIDLAQTYGLRNYR